MLPSRFWNRDGGTFEASTQYHVVSDVPHWPINAVDLSVVKTYPIPYSFVGPLESQGWKEEIRLGHREHPGLAGWQKDRRLGSSGQRRDLC